MLDPIPVRPSEPRTQWFFLLASFGLVYGAALFFFVHHVWSLGGFDGGLQKHADYWLQGVRAIFFRNPKAVAPWNFYLHFLSEHRLWTPLIVRVTGAFLVLHVTVGFLLSRVPLQQRIEFHARRLGDRPDFKKNLALSDVWLDIIKRTRGPSIDELKLHPKVAEVPSPIAAGAKCPSEGTTSTNASDTPTARSVEKPQRYTTCLLP